MKSQAHIPLKLRIIMLINDFGEKSIKETFYSSTQGKEVNNLLFL